MAGRIISVDEFWDSQPQHPVGLTELCRRPQIVHCGSWSFSDKYYDSATNSVKSISSSLLNAVTTPHGIGVVPSNANNCYYGNISNADLDTAGSVQAFLFVFIAQPTPSGNGRLICSVKNTTTAHVGVDLDGGNAFKLRFGTSGPVTPNIAVPAVDSGLKVVTARMTDSLQEVWCNGQKIHSGAGSYSWGNDTTALEYTQNSEQRAPVLLKVVWTGAAYTPSAAELEELSRTPWKIFRRFPRVLDFDAGGGTLIDLTSSAAATAAASAALSVSVPLAGASIAVATATGAVSIGVNMAGGDGAQAAASATLTTAGNADLSGAAGASSTALGSLSLAVTLSASALVQALALAGLSQGVPLGGGDGAQAAASGVISLNVSLAGNPIAQAAASAGLSVTGANDLAGNAAASASAAASLGIDVSMFGIALTVAASTGNVTHLVPIITSAASASLATGGLDIAVRIDAAALVQALAAAGLTVGSNMSGNAAAQPGATGTVTLRVNLDTAAVVQAIAAGALSADGLIVAGTPGYRVSRAPRSWSVSATPRNWRVSRPARSWRVTA